MAAVTASACVVPAQFTGLRPLSKAQTSKVSFHAKTRYAVAKSRTTCDLNTSAVISASTASLLFLGRFTFLPFQKAQIAKQGLPVQNGVPHAEAGDSRAVEVSSMLKTKDPAGFTLVDVLAWGALGHAIGYAILAAGSNGYTPQF